MISRNGVKDATTGQAIEVSPQIEKPKLVKVVMTNSDAIIANDATNTNGTADVKNGYGQRQQKPPGRTVKRFYIDELGFYRYLDAEEKQYVCSNVSTIDRKDHTSAALTTATTTANTTTSTTTNGSNQGGAGGRRISSSSSQNGEAKGLEVCFKNLRHDLGISHFDKIEEYESWKSGWDEFMRIKLTSQQPVTLNRELKSLVRSGIPHDYRRKVWSALIRMRTRNIRAQFGEDIYEIIIRDIVSRVDIPDYSNTPDGLMPNNDRNNNSSGSTKPKSHRRANGGSSYIGPPVNGGQPQARTLSDATNTQSKTQPLLKQDQQLDKCFKQIELDLLRTLPNNRHFEDPNSIGIHRVRRVLRAYACFNQAVGYCQGMNRLAAMALLVLPEEEAFWCLVAIVQCIMPKDYYLKPWLAQVDCCVLSDLLEKKMPKLHKHLVKNDIQLTLFTWFFTIFVDGFRPELLLRIWDCFLLEGDKVLFRFALAILHICQEELLRMNDFSTMSLHLSRLVSTRKLDVEHLFQSKLSNRHCNREELPKCRGQQASTNSFAPFDLQTQ